jgi:hypothetical protein
MLVLMLVLLLCLTSPLCLSLRPVVALLQYKLLTTLAQESATVCMQQSGTATSTRTAEALQRNCCV